jgi:hypothetical protein
MAAETEDGAVIEGILSIVPSRLNVVIVVFSICEERATIFAATSGAVKGR